MKNESNKKLSVVISFLEAFSLLARGLGCFSILFCLVFLGGEGEHLTVFEWFSQVWIFLGMAFGYIAMFFTRYVGALIVLALYSYINLLMCLQGGCLFEGDTPIVPFIMYALPASMYLILYIFKSYLGKFNNGT